MRLSLTAILLLLSLLISAKPRRGDALVTFSLKDGRYEAQVNKKGWIGPKTIPLCEESALSKVISGGPELYQKESSVGLYKTLIKPLSQYLKPGERLFFIPAGNIHFINLGALTDETGKRLCDKYSFKRLSSWDEYGKTEDKPNRAKWLLFGGMDYLADPEQMYGSVRMLHIHNTEHLYKDIVPSGPDDELSFGIAKDGTRAGYNNLEHSRGEIKDLWAIRDFMMSFFTGFKACEEEFRFMIRTSEPYIVLISTHGFIKGEGEKASCGLLFSGAGHTIEGRKLPHNLNDGILHDQEIETLDMSAASMVVLAACNTGIGIVTQEGIKGLQSAFKKAGAQTLVMTLWSVNDKATAAFTKSLFSHIGKSKTKHEAFEAAIQDLRNSEEFSDPAYWAPFIMLD
ncbi:MAG: CHAT domain-containing protein [Bacteroidales bacterium]|nr:CHAT domain-containing protein [Bacteroidales bacterium]